MKAFQIDRYKDRVHLAEVTEPTPGAHDVLVRVHAAGVNQLDVKIGEGEFRALLPYKTPLTLGHDLAGVVERVGSAVTTFAVGDEVFSRVADHRIGTFTELIAVAEADLALKPTELSMTEAASLPLVALTAWQALVEQAKVRPGQRVLIHGGSGGFGSIAIQLARHLGAHVTTTASGSNSEWLRKIGAHEVIDYRTQDFAELLADYDVVVDGVGGGNLQKSLRVLRRGGIAISLVGPPDPAFARAAGLNPVLRLLFTVLSAKVRRQARRLGVEYEFLFMRASGSQLAQIAALVGSGEIRPVVGRVFPFAETPEALDASTRGGVRGKIVVSVRD